MRLHDITCTTNRIEVKYEYQGARETLETLSILYTCQHLNGTQVKYIKIIIMKTEVDLDGSLASDSG